MKKDKKIIVLSILIIVLTISIISLMILVIVKKQNNNNDDNDNTLNNNEHINYWTLYKQSIINGDEVIYSIDTNDIILNIKDDYIDICYNEDNNERCDDVKYTYDNNTLTILEDNQHLQGDYNVYFSDNTMILEKIENEEKNVKINNYFQKAEG